MVGAEEFCADESIVLDRKVILYQMESDFRVEYAYLCSSWCTYVVLCNTADLNNI